MESPPPVLPPCCWESGRSGPPHSPSSLPSPGWGRSGPRCRGRRPAWPPGCTARWEPGPGSSGRLSCCERIWSDLHWFPGQEINHPEQQWVVRTDLADEGEKEERENVRTHHSQTYLLWCILHCQSVSQSLPYLSVWEFTEILYLSQLQFFVHFIIL